MIYTFYSYKGGVGRSMALANIAELFYEAGLRVIIVDWDLEAPGLERFFWNEPPENVLNSSGVMDLILGYKQQIANGLSVDDYESAIDKLPFEKPEKCFIDIHPEYTDSGRFWLLTAGKRLGRNLDNYTDNVINFNWRDFYINWGGEVYIEWLRRELERLADVILIDSRTGLSEMGGVCTYQLADTVVMFSTPNMQNIIGTFELAKRLKAPEVIKRRANRPLDLMVLPSRIERDQPELLEVFKNEFIIRFKDLIPKTNGITIDRLWDLGIPYIAKYAFQEGVAVRERNLAIAKEIYRVYYRISQFMRRYELVNLIPNDVDSIIKPTKSPLLIIISGPSGSGKDSVLRELRRRNLPYHFVVTVTTRTPRSNEKDGIDYIFNKKEDFEKMIENDDFLEYGVVYDAYKGIPKSQIRDALSSGEDVILRVDVQGAWKIRTIVPEAVLIFLTAENEEELMFRVRTRNTETPESLSLRMSVLQREIEQIPEFDYLVINSHMKLSETADQIVKIIDIEHQRVHPRKIIL